MAVPEKAATRPGGRRRPGPARRPRPGEDRLRETTVRWLADRGVSLEDIGNIVLEIQAPFYDSLTLNECVESVNRVIDKREVQHAVITGIALDILAEQGKLPEPLQGTIIRDDSLFGIDEVLALSITNVYGSIGLTNFGYLDKVKLGVIARLNGRGPHCHTFLDDLVAGIAAAAAARIAHTRGHD